MFIFQREFVLAALERALKTAAQAAILAILGTGAMNAANPQVNAFSIDWGYVAGFALGGFVLSWLTSVASSRVGKWPGPSLTDEAVVYEEIIDYDD